MIDTIKLAYDLHQPDGRLRQQPVPSTNYRPVCQQSWSQGLPLGRTCSFFPSSGRNSLLPTHGGMAQAEPTWVPSSVPRWFTRPKTVTHPGTNRARRRITTLIESNALPLRDAGTIKQGYKQSD